MKTVTYIFEPEKVVAEFKIDERFVLMEAIHKHTSNVLIKLVVSKVKTEKALVLHQS